jgi:predicted DNA-binding transcriptional regulator AlpA
MSSTHIPSKTAMANECGITRNTLARWMKRPDFPPETSSGWEREAVLTFAKSALARAAKCQTGQDSDLKRRKLELQCSILETELQRKQGELSIETEGTIPRPVAIEQMQMVCFAVWSAMNAKIVTMGNTIFKSENACYHALCNSGTDFLQAAKKEVARRLKDSPLKLTEAEILDCTTYSGGNRW